MSARHDPPRACLAPPRASGRAVKPFSAALHDESVLGKGPAGLARPTAAVRTIRARGRGLSGSAWEPPSARARRRPRRNRFRSAQKGFGPGRVKKSKGDDPVGAPFAPSRVSPATTRRSQTPRSTWPQPEDSSSQGEDCTGPGRSRPSHARPCTTRLCTVAAFLHRPCPPGQAPAAAGGAASTRRRRRSESTARPSPVPAEGRT